MNVIDKLTKWHMVIGLGIGFMGSKVYSLTPVSATTVGIAGAIIFLLGVYKVAKYSKMLKEKNE